MSVIMNGPDVSRESSETSGSVEERLARLEAKVDELLTDSRAARPLLDRYLKMSAAPWAGRVGKGRQR